jgi:uncharacterized membrane protein
MIESFAEVVVISFAMGGLAGAVVALKLAAPQKAKAEANTTESTVESGLPK